MTPSRRAFATPTALIMLALFATVATLSMNGLRAQAHRTTRDADDAQLRQLLHAGHLVASDLPNIWNTTGVQRQSLDLPLPPDLQSRPASLRLTTTGSPDGSTATTTLTATYDQKSTTEQITFTHTDQGWRLTSLTPD